MLHCKKNTVLWMCLFSAALLVCGRPADVSAKQKSWNKIVVSEIKNSEDGGGYSTMRVTDAYPQSSWEGMEKAWSWSEEDGIVIDLNEARPSFCSSACYMMLLKSLSVWDEKGVIGEEAWTALRPYTMEDMEYAIQDDGIGCWGYANANGPGIAMLVKRLNAGRNYYIGGRSEYASAAKYRKAWNKAKKGDFLKIFWNRKIGRDESGHQVIFMGRKRSYVDGVRDDLIYYWSSQGGTDGYGVTSCRASKIRRAVLTKITRPAAFADAMKRLPPRRKNKWLASLLKKNVSVRTMKKKVL
ncbi:MAG: hypothetical protein IJJ38_12460 [Lachnospiraceae bacterium]|nr:hypothetical protein [Lachnospiraceae bacterium]